MTPDPTAAFERYVDRLTGADDIDCPTCGEPVPFAEVCAGCGWHEGQYLEDEDQAWDRWREDRLGRGLELWEGEDG